MVTVLEEEGNKILKTVLVKGTTCSLTTSYTCASNMYVIDEHLFERFIDSVDNSVVPHSYPQKPPLSRDAQFTISVRVGSFSSDFNAA